MNTIGLDIGGANLKASDGERTSVSRSFPLWSNPDRLTDELRATLPQFERADSLAVTMTGELADCFATKAEGVAFILSAVCEVAEGRTVHVWQTVGEFVSTAVAVEFPRLTAAANWHALATWAGRAAPQGAALLFDVGSTTTDIIPIQDGLPMPTGRTDVERLVSGELVYSGVRRTPLSAIAHSAPFRDGYCPLAAEAFATTWDVYLWLGDIGEEPDATETADGRPATREAARDRLARMLCCDRTEFTAEDADLLARFLADVQRRRIDGCLERVCSQLGGPVRTVILAGEGEFLAERIVRRSGRLAESQTVSLRSTLGPEHSQSACAYALAQLAGERLQSDRVESCTHRRWHRGQ